MRFHSPHRLCIFSQGLPRTAPPIRDTTHFTHGRDWQGFAIDDRSCCIVSRSRPLTACQGPKQLLLHLHGYSIQVHDVPATCLSAPSAKQTCLAGLVCQSARGIPSSVRFDAQGTHEGLRSRYCFDLWDTIYFKYDTHRSNSVQVHCTDSVASCLACLPVCLSIPA